QPNWAAVSFSSQPSGASVIIDDTVVGETPLSADILDGAHQLAIRLDGYKEVQQALMVEAGQPLTLPEFVLDEADAILRLASTPSGANVTVNGTFRGQTPLTLALEPAELSALRLFKDGYAAATRRITLGSGEERSMSVSLSAQLGTIRFSATPGEAELLIDGRSRGTADQVVELPTRSHAIEIRKPGYLPYKTTITPRAGVEQRVEARLQTEAERREASIKPVIATSQGHQLRLFSGGSFEMGASRRERGRRSNEALHPVVLSRRFYVAVNEVTNKQYRAFRPAHSSGAFDREDLDAPAQPVAKVSWDDAAAYCNWLSAGESLPPFYRVTAGKVTGSDPASTGYRLPSEAEWAFVARVLPDGTMLQNAWGGGFPPSRITGNYADQSAAVLLARTLADYNDRYAAAAPPGSFKANARGLNDLDGNVAEWVHDVYTGAITDKTPARDPLGPATGRYHVIRGASWAHGTVTELRLAFRDFGEASREDLGFRIARYLE
ncbi:MAG: SUMF1/EgtB/PvdO family nonheme iron enzyme, partial [Gammaproteobacteria bacterium]|nr:SUMF1/EgtB/PvdO family nonheme iron enzyme [Gammaproteobacteria bacterium]